MNRKPIWLLKQERIEELTDISANLLEELEKIVKLADSGEIVEKNCCIPIVFETARNLIKKAREIDISDN